MPRTTPLISLSLDPDALALVREALRAPDRRRLTANQIGAIRRAADAVQAAERQLDRIAGAEQIGTTGMFQVLRSADDGALLLHDPTTGLVLDVCDLDNLPRSRDLTSMSANPE